MRVEIALDGDRLVGGLPLEVERRRGGLQVAHFMGRHHAPLADVLVAKCYDEQQIGRGLIERAGFFGITHDSALSRIAAESATLVERIEAPFIDLSRGWDEIYRERTSAKRRNLHKRRRRQLGELGELTIETARTEDELVAALEVAFHLHDLRWVGRHDGSELTTPVGKAFHREVVRSLGARDMARILTMRIDGASSWRVFRLIVLPLSAAPLVTLASSRCASTARRSRSTTGFSTRGACTCTDLRSIRRSPSTRPV